MSNIEIEHNSISGHLSFMRRKENCKTSHCMQKLQGSNAYPKSSPCMRGPGCLNRIRVRQITEENPNFFLVGGKLSFFTNVSWKLRGIGRPEYLFEPFCTQSLGSQLCFMWSMRQCAERATSCSTFLVQR